MQTKHIPKVLRVVLMAFALFIGLSSALNVLPSAEAQCTPRTDWNIYIVVRGDTLARIAARFGTTATALANANCLTNPSRILVGQRLYVPPPSNTSGSRDVGATFQAFERGFMTWRADTGDVNVYFNGGNSGVVLNYTPGAYASLPENPFTETPPSGRIRPSFGFGKVWGNFSNVRLGLGWAIANEVGYLMRVTFGTGDYSFSIPGGAVISNVRRTWTLVSGSLPSGIGTGSSTGGTTGGSTTGGTNQVISQASFQQFEYGFMVWRADTGEINVYYNTGTNTGGVISYSVTAYAYMPENPVTETPPAGRVRPILGMGKVWGNVPTVRHNLGWATAGEQSYRATFTYPGTTSYQFTIPNGSIISNTFNQTWTVVSGSGVPSVSRPGGGTTGGSTTGGGNTVFTTQGAFQQFEYGFMTWRADTGEIIVYYNTANNAGGVISYPLTAYSYMPENPVVETPPTGRVRPILGFGRVWGNVPTVRNNLGWATAGEMGLTMTLTYVSTTTFQFNIPNASVIANVNNQTWSVLSGSGVPSVPRPGGGTTGGTTTGGTTTGGTTTGGGSTATGTLALAPYGSFVSDTATYTLFNGQSVTLTWSSPASGTTLVNFVLTRSDNTNQIIASDTNVNDGISATWTVENNVTGTITANGYTTSNTQSGRSPTVNILSGATPTSTTNGAFQAYERGFMIWRQDTQAIAVFVNASSVNYYPLENYINLPDNPVTDSTPLGMVRPMSGFGRVWGNYAMLRSAIGWATAAEQGYSITFRAVAGVNGTQTCFNLPDGRYVTASIQTWQYVTSCG